MSDNMNHVVMFSGGIGSWATGKRVAEEHGTDSLILLFTDTLIEDFDTYRFLIEGAVNVFGGVPKCKERDLEDLIRVVLNDIPKRFSDERRRVLERVRKDASIIIPGLRWIADGRSPFEVMRDTKSFPRAGIDPCSRVLKRELADRWVSDNFEPENVICYVGIDWSEYHRYERLVEYKKPWVYKAPLCEKPYMTKEELHSWAEREGIEKQRLYKMGMPHANCGGGCIKMGQGGFARLFKNDPEKFAEWEEDELILQEALGLDMTILKSQVGGEVKPLSLRDLRKRLEADDMSQVDLFDVGGCGCFFADGDSGGSIEMVKNDTSCST